MSALPPPPSTWVKQHRAKQREKMSANQDVLGVLGVQSRIARQSFRFASPRIGVQSRIASGRKLRGSIAVAAHAPVALPYDGGSLVQSSTYALQPRLHSELRQQHHHQQHGAAGEYGQMLQGVSTASLLMPSGALSAPPVAPLVGRPASRSHERLASSLRGTSWDEEIVQSALHFSAAAPIRAPLAPTSSTFSSLRRGSSAVALMGSAELKRRESTSVRRASSAVGGIVSLAASASFRRQSHAAAPASSSPRLHNRTLTPTMGGAWPQPHAEVAELDDSAVSRLRTLAQAIFRRLDCDHSGSLSTEEAAVVFGEDEQWGFILDEADVDGDGELSIEEWTEYIVETGHEDGVEEVAAGLSQMLAQISHDAVASSTMSEEEISELRGFAGSVFVMLDTDGSGSLSTEEAAVIFAEDEQWSFILEEADTDGDGELSVEEWQAYILKMARVDGVEEAIEALETMRTEIEDRSPRAAAAVGTGTTAAAPLVARLVVSATATATPLIARVVVSAVSLRPGEDLFSASLGGGAGGRGAKSWVEDATQTRARNSVVTRRARPRPQRMAAPIAPSPAHVVRAASVVRVPSVLKHARPHARTQLAPETAFAGAEALAQAMKQQSSAFTLPRSDAANDYAMEKMPERYVQVCSGDVAKAQARWGATLLWREESAANVLLYSPQRHFLRLQTLYPSFFHGRDREGARVWYEQLGRVDVSALQRSGCSIDDVLMHKTFVSEWLWRVAEPNPEAQALMVIDLEGLKLGDFKGIATQFIRRYAQLMAMHYPRRTKMIVVINAPFFFPAVWKIAARALDPETRSKVVIWKRPKAKKGKKRSGRCSALERYITIEEQPRCYGHPWKSTYQWGQAPEQLELEQWVRQLEAGMSAAEAATLSGGGESAAHLASRAMKAHFRAASDAMSSRALLAAVSGLAEEAEGAAY